MPLNMDLHAFPGKLKVYSMKIVFPKDDAKYHWTNHVKRKMVYYGLSGNRIKRILCSPKRVQKGVAADTVAVMQNAGTKSKPMEIWVMYSLSSKKVSVLGVNRKTIISAWRYPGMSKSGKAIPIPENILEELKNKGVIT